ncbi:hypothetical protein ACGFNX_40600 [Streptomyces sp. NPDC048723]|uniref:hypothetical protein n=1 Tax=Streptomyces sp. NPDC048723 TaxID=3365589 RepID=UPI003719C588
MPLRRCRLRVTASAAGHLVRAGLLVYLGGEVAFPDVHPDQVDTLARRRDLPALLDRHVPLGPDQAARRLGVRRVDFDAAVRLGFLSPIGTVDVDYKSHGGWTTVPLYSAQDVALLPVVRPLADWQAVATARTGRRSPPSPRSSRARTGPAPSLPARRSAVRPRRPHAHGRSGNGKSNAGAGRRRPGPARSADVRSTPTTNGTRELRPVDCAASAGPEPTTRPARPASAPRSRRPWTVRPKRMAGSAGAAADQRP